MDPHYLGEIFAIVTVAILFPILLYKIIFRILSANKRLRLNTRKTSTSASVLPQLMAIASWLQSFSSATSQPEYLLGNTIGVIVVSWYLYRQRRADAQEDPTP